MYINGLEGVHHLVEASHLIVHGLGDTVSAHPAGLEMQHLISLRVRTTLPLVPR